MSGDITHVNVIMLPIPYVAVANVTQEAFSAFSGHPRTVDISNPINIFTLCDSNQREVLKTHWVRLSAGKESNFTLSFTNNGQMPRWVQAACSPVINNGSTVESVTGCVTDITAQKRVEWEAIKRAKVLEQLRLSELRLLQEAIEAKRQQEK